MPTIDMPLSELRKYNGSSPCPTDIDEFWDESIAEMKALDPQTKLVKSSFQTPAAECFDLFFAGTGGSRIHAKYLRPSKIEKPCPAVLIFHGYSGNSGDWSDKLAYVANGMCVLALDCRGQGGLSEDKGIARGNTLMGHIVMGIDCDSPKELYFRNVFLDTALLARIAMSFDEIDENRVAAIGGSQGGALTLACASLEQKIKLAAPIFPFLCDYKRVWDMDLAVAAYQGIKDYFRMFDPTHSREDEIFYKLGYIDLQNITKRIKAKTLMQTGLMDNICPPSTQFAAYNKITAEKDIIIYPDYGHEGIPQTVDRTYEFLLKL